ncbi:hypothetical protein MY11210_006070 [Beauveria gryllotalpidicola]
MADQPRSEIIKLYPIGKGLDAFRASVISVCEDNGIPCTPDALGQLGEQYIRNRSIRLLSDLLDLPATRVLRSQTNYGMLQDDLLKLISAISSDGFDLERIKPLLKATIANESDNDIWDQVYEAIIEHTPPPRQITSSLLQTPWLRNTSSFANSSEHRKYVDDVLKEELGTMYVGLRDFHKTYFGDVAALEVSSKAIFKQCLEGSDALFNDGWKGWPKKANQDEVLSWFADFSEKLDAFATAQKSHPAYRRRLIAKPNKWIDGSVGKRKMDLGFVNAPNKIDLRCHWSQILVPGELKSNPAADKASEAWLDLGRYAREVLSAQDTRRFILGFTICGSFMRVWAFDRLGGIASEQFDINKDGQRFIFTILGFLWMNEEQLGFDPTIRTVNEQRFIDIKRNNASERIIIDQVMQRSRCIAGRATTCWKAHREGQPEIPLVIKDSWQFSERDNEGDMLQEATNNGVINVARYFYHETVQVRGLDDDIQGNIRRGLDSTRAENHRPKRPLVPSTTTSNTSRKGRSGRKRSSSQGASFPPGKRSCSVSPTKAAASTPPNRVHRRIILRDYGKPIYQASSPIAMLTALEGCIKGHESLYKQGLLHRDISINNLMINEDSNNPSWPSFLIDLDLAIKEARKTTTGAKGKTGTRVFMAMGVLLNEQHCFMHDLESFFWVLFWICIHYNEAGEGRVVERFEKWNYVDMEDLAGLKLGIVSIEGDFIRTAEENFTPYYQPLIPWVNRLRKAIFPNGRRWVNKDPGLYSRIGDILHKAKSDPMVAGT